MGMKKTLILLVIVILILCQIFYNKYNIKYEPFITYTKCKKMTVGKLNTKIFNKHNIVYSENSDIFIPCGYNSVEKQLKEYKPLNKNQNIYAVSGCDKIVSKNNLWKILHDTYGRNK